MVMKTFYFTATGNSLAVAKEIGGELYSIPQVVKHSQTKFSADKIGLVFPCYYMGTPQIVRNFIEQVELESDYIFAVMTYGNFSASGVHHFQRLAAKEGLQLDYTNELLMIDNYLPLYDITAELAKEDSKNIKENLTNLVNDIKQERKSLLKQKWWERLITFFSYKFYQFKRGAADKKFSVTEDCTSCKVCEQVCPVDNITVKEKPDYHHHCEECMACINLCPENAIKHSKEQGDKRFKNKNVKLKEIIQSNR